MQVARQNYIFRHPSPRLFPASMCRQRAFLQDWRWTRLGVALSLSGGSGWADDCYTFPRSSCSFSHSWATCVQLHDKGHQQIAPAGHPLRQVGGENRQGFLSMRELWLLLPHFLSTFPSPPPALQMSSSNTRQEDNLLDSLTSCHYLSKVKTL